MAIDTEKMISDSLKHLTERVKASKGLEPLLDEFKKAREIGIKDLSSKEAWVKSYIKLLCQTYKSGLLSEAEFFFDQYSIIVSCVHEGRWLDGHYDNELDPISEKLRAIEKEHGLSSDEYWAKGDAPEDHQKLNEEYDKTLDSKLDLVLAEFGTGELVELLNDDREKLDIYIETGGSLSNIKGEINRLKALATVYEDESKICESGEVFYSASIMLSSAMEARLIIQCLEHREEVREALVKMGLSNKTLKSKNPLEWKLNTLIEVSYNCGWLPNLDISEHIFSPKDIGHALRSTRNLVHPGMHIKRNASLSFGKEQFKDMRAAYILVSKLLNWPNS